MAKYLLILLSINLIFAGLLKEDSLSGIDIEISNGRMRYTTPGGMKLQSFPPTIKYGPSRAETLWVDRNHQFAIADHLSLSGNGMYIQAGWWLNNEEWYIPVDVSITGEDIGVGSGGEPLYSFTANSAAPKWSFDLPAGYKIATSSQGSSVGVSDDGQGGIQFITMVRLLLRYPVMESIL